MDFSIREINIHDSEGVRALTKQLGYTISNEQTKESIQYILTNPEHCAYIASNKDKVLGWIQAFIAVRLESTFVEISGLVVDESARGMGIGKKLIEKVREWCNNKNCETLRVRCNVKRIESHKFYMKLGFIENKEQKVFQVNL
jgi:GNAT superfamily N-acetyltransferase